MKCQNNYIKTEIHATTGASEANTNNAGNDGNVYDADYKVEDDNK